MDKGLFGLINYENTPLGLTEEDGLISALAKGCGRGVLEYSTLFGGLILVAGVIDKIMDNK